MTSLQLKVNMRYAGVLTQQRMLVRLLLKVQHSLKECILHLDELLRNDKVVAVLV